MLTLRPFQLGSRTRRGSLREFRRRRGTYGHSAYHISSLLNSLSSSTVIRWRLERDQGELSISRVVLLAQRLNDMLYSSVDDV